MSVRFDAQAVSRMLESRQRLSVKLDGFREAAVLVPIVVEPGAPDRMLFTVRHADLTTHAGQIAFPGGKRDPGDVDLQATAIREAAEELGIEAASVEVLGLLDDVPTPSGFVITPVLARVRGPLELRPSANEVAAVFECDLGQLGGSDGYVDAGTRSFLGVTYAMHEYHVTARDVRHRIWGATARMVYQVLELAAATSA
jgi:8-oxo-dGTP pyrophosphatase MutT (NUDIX family)